MSEHVCNHDDFTRNIKSFHIKTQIEKKIKKSTNVLTKFENTFRYNINTSKNVTKYIEIIVKIILNGKKIKKIINS